jgi:hypothetical protein
MYKNIKIFGNEVVHGDWKMGNKWTFGIDMLLFKLFLPISE